MRSVKIGVNNLLGRNGCYLAGRLSVSMALIGIYTFVALLVSKTDSFKWSYDSQSFMASGMLENASPFEASCYNLYISMRLWISAEVLNFGIGLESRKKTLRRILSTMTWTHHSKFLLLSEPSSVPLSFRIDVIHAYNIWIQYRIWNERKLYIK